MRKLYYTAALAALTIQMCTTVQGATATNEPAVVAPVAPVASATSESDPSLTELQAKAVASQAKSEIATFGTKFDCQSIWSHLCGKSNKELDVKALNDCSPPEVRSKARKCFANICEKLKKDMSYKTQVLAEVTTETKAMIPQICPEVTLS
jgi:hypothetical protein